MRIVIVSDTHGHHEQLGVLEGDVLLHCGDGCAGEASVDRLDDWFSRQRFRHILAVAGNHDHGIEARLRRGAPAFRHARLLHDAAVQIDGRVFYGSPWVPDLQGWAFYADDRALQDRWAAIPEKVDVLITHTPAAGVLDRDRAGASLGCPHLARALAQRDVGLHAFGHVHASGGRQRGEAGALRVNAALLHHGSPRLRPPIAVELPAAR